MNINRRRVGPKIMPALLGAVILTDVTHVSARIRLPPTPGAAMQPGQQAQIRTPAGPWRVLTGIIAYTDPRQGFAMIGNSVQNTYLARPGDQLPDGSRIREIRPTHIVLEVGGNLETVGIFEHDQPAGAVYIPPPPMPIMPTPPAPQQSKWEEMELRQMAAGDATPPRLPRSIDPPPGELRPTDTPPGDAPPNKARASEVTAVDTAPIDGPPTQAQPPNPLTPTTQDPADEFGGDRRQRAEERKK
jgi:hypothetical protein